VTDPESISAVETAARASARAINLHVWRDDSSEDSRMLHLGIRFGVAKEICDAFGVKLDPSWIDTNA